MNLKDKIKYFLKSEVKFSPKDKAEWMIDYHIRRVEKYIEIIVEFCPSYLNRFSDCVEGDFSDYIWNRYHGKELIEEHCDPEMVGALEERLILLRKRYYTKICPRRGLKAV